MGTILAGEVFQTWPKLQSIENAPLRVRSATVALPLAKIAPGEVEKARSTIDRMGQSKGGPGFLELVKAFQVLDVDARQGKPIDVEVQVIALGDSVAWVSLPGEIFVELGLEIKQDSPFAHTIIAELANGAIGYIPSRRAYAQGNYEVVSARCAEGSGEMLVAAAVRMLTEMHREATSESRR
jgi:neutral ceramidase